MGTESPGIWVYVACASIDEARRVGRVLVEERLAACVNILPGIESIYRWQGEVETASEAAFLAKTRADGFDAAARRVKELHSYDTPCIVAVPWSDAEPAFLRWIQENTR